MEESRVSVVEMEHCEMGYPKKAPFHPDKNYLELGNLPMQIDIDERNEVYECVRKALICMGMDKENMGTQNWNPFAEIIKKGDTVVIKPNFVLDNNPNDRTSQSTVTNGSVIRPIIDYVLLALKGKGKIIIADAPQMNCNFDRLIKKNGMEDVFRYYQRALSSSEIDIDLRDLRRERTIYKDGVVWERIPLAGDPEGYTIVDLKNESEFKNIDPRSFYGADYNRKETIKAHSKGHHKYYIANTILKADVIISMPKLKVHRKTGVTLNLKNMVGINGNKNYLVHYRVGTKLQGGDEFSSENKIHKMDRRIKDLTVGKNWKFGKYLFYSYKKVKQLMNIHSSEKDSTQGDWYGNDTTWRMAVDLNKILFYCDKNGKMRKQKQRRYFSVIDGIVGGEGEGPLHPTKVNSGVIIMGMNPIAVDIVATTYMGLDYRKIKKLNNSQIARNKIMKFLPDEIEILSADNKISKNVKSFQAKYRYKVPKGWQGYL